jgi:hypothetical protein
MNVENVTYKEVRGWNELHGEALTYNEYITMISSDRESRYYLAWEFHKGWYACNVFGKDGAV